MEVLVGLDSMDDLKSVDKRNISSVIIHEAFTSTAVRDENDIAIATLNMPIQFSDNIVPICLPEVGKYNKILLCTTSFNQVPARLSSFTRSLELKKYITYFFRHVNTD